MDDDLLDKMSNYIKKINRDKKIKNYYLKKMKDGKGYNAVVIDSVLIKLILSIVFLIYLFIQTNNIVFSIIISISALIFVLYISYYFKMRKFKKKILDINNDLSKKKIMKEINTFTNYEFILYVKKVLENYYNTSFVEYENDIDLIGQIHDKIYAVKCIRIAQDERVTTRDIKSFKYHMSMMGAEEGICVTSSYFVEGIKEEYKDIEFIDFEKLLFILKKVNMYPSKDDIEEIIINKYKENKNKVMSAKNHVFSSEKVFRYLFLGMTLYVLSKSTSFGLYYKIMAIFSLIFGLVSIFYGVIYEMIIKKHIY
ncbi:MAG: Restriction endonuclease [Sporanaerobacter sp.]|uniref:restriction endonuclease n=1 Tax=Sporanaerobacter sp. TaxID=2010183 RepID=UPI003A100D87